MKKFFIVYKDGNQQTVMPAMHDTRKKAEEALMEYIHYYNKSATNYVSLFDFAIEEEEYPEPNEIIQDFESAKQLIGSTGFILAKDSLRYAVVEFSIKNANALIALNQLLVIAQAWNILDNFIPDFSDSNQAKWFSWFKYKKDVGKFVYTQSYTSPVGTNACISSLLCFKTQERADQFGKQFVDLFNKAFQ